MKNSASIILMVSVAAVLASVDAAAGYPDSLNMTCSQAKDYIAKNDGPFLRPDTRMQVSIPPIVRVSLPMFAPRTKGIVSSVCIAIASWCIASNRTSKGPTSDRPVGFRERASSIEFQLSTGTEGRVRARQRLGSDRERRARLAFRATP